MDALLFWNNVVLDAVATDHTGAVSTVNQRGPTRTSRALALVHLAMYDAFNNANTAFEAYLKGLIPSIAGASADAALGEAAYVTLSMLYPQQIPIFLDQRQRFFVQLSGSSQSIEDGKSQGRKIAELLIKSRQNKEILANFTSNSSQISGQNWIDFVAPEQSFLGEDWGYLTPFALNNVKLDSVQRHCCVGSASSSVS